ncbi:lipopolysaccharide transport system permease protein [Roseimicrobium gellanilyticum]|uniref:Transport permease protein n=1 Tax=Roseimicrobium gellanilyticum TaxID=748857 RepID=A0A366HVK3_9BACT|nr:ABC transporter permease [Roseimicrobium gellanilyticum]RBP48127.1 lipopolysaccharide transport system permease protein [Roseimicrobium gellanilyticum]
MSAQSDTPPSVQTSTEDWDLVIRPRSGWFELHLEDLWRYRDLVRMFVRRDFVAQYKQTILGPLWFIIQPLLTTLTFTVIFSGVAKLSTDGLPPLLFYLAGTTPWNYFSTCVTKTSTTFTANANIFGKVYFPRLVTPLSIVISTLIQFGIQFALLLGMLGWYLLQGTPLNPNWLAIVGMTPLLILLMGSLGLGFGIIVSSLTTKYRDLSFLVTFGIQLAMYATPVVYPLSTVSEKYRTWLELNPMTAIVEAFRAVYLGAGTFSWPDLGYSAIFTVVTLALGVLIFNRVEKTFMDTV